MLPRMSRWRRPHHAKQDTLRLCDVREHRRNASSGYMSKTTQYIAARKTLMQKCARRDMRAQRKRAPLLRVIDPYTAAAKLLPCLTPTLPPRHDATGSPFARTEETASCHAINLSPEHLCAGMSPPPPRQAQRAGSAAWRSPLRHAITHVCRCLLLFRRAAIALSAFTEALFPARCGQSSTFDYSPEDSVL